MHPYVCVCVREKEREGGRRKEEAGASGLESNASTAGSCPHNVWD